MDFLSNNEEQKDIFEKIIGQDAVKKQTRFYLSAARATGVLPHILYIGEKGGGKTTLCKLLSKALDREHGKLINCASVKTLDNLVEQTFDPYQGKEVVFIFDECLMLPKKVQMAYLTILGDGAERRTNFTYQTREGLFNLEFDFTKMSFIFATTERQAIFEPLLDRLQQISFAPYSREELGKILQFHSKGVTYEKDALDKLTSYCRGNPRSAAKIAKSMVKNYCAIHDNDVIKLEDVAEIKNILGIYELGLDSIEFNILSKVYEHSPISLTALRSMTGLGREAEQDAERYLLKLNLIDIDGGKRTITKKGKNYLEAIETNGA